jgi:nucleotide-binding universal stress UspA family protein
MNESWTIKTIVLGYDGSEGAARALQLTAALAGMTNAKVVVVNAFETTLVVNSFETRSTELQEARLGRIVAKAEATADEGVRELEKAGIVAEADVLEGSAGECLLGVADSRKADLIVVGRRGHGLLADLLLGSTSEYVVRRAKVPVLVAH